MMGQASEGLKVLVDMRSILLKSFRHSLEVQLLKLISSVKWVSEEAESISVILVELE